MNTTTHPVAPEEVMALLDGELSPEQAQAVTEHLSQCERCGTLVSEFRAQSKEFSNCEISRVPERVSKRVGEFTKTIRSGQNVSHASLFIRASLWGWKKWAALASVCAFCLLLLAAVSIPNLMRSRMAANESSAAGSLRTLNSGIESYSAQYGRLPDSIQDLGPGTGGSASRDRAGLVDGTLASGHKEGYQFSYRHSANDYTISADPIAGAGARHFSTDQSGAIRVDGQQIDGSQPASGANLSARATVKEHSIATDLIGPMQGRGDYVQSDASLGHGSGAGRGPSDLQQPMIARTTSLSLVVWDFAASRANLDTILRRHHGYAANLTANTAENTPRSIEASLRVPAPELDGALADLKALGKVQKESQSGEEVTQQHADLVARLKNSRETEQRLQTILAQRTGKVKDVLEVEQEIARVRGEIEQMEAEQKSLEHRVDFATVNLSLAEEYKAQLVPPAISAGTRLHNALIEGYRGATETLLGIVLFFAEYTLTLLIWGMILVLPVFLLWKRYRRSLAATEQI